LETLRKNDTEKVKIGSSTIFYKVEDGRYCDLSAENEYCLDENPLKNYQIDVEVENHEGQHLVYPYLLSVRIFLTNNTINIASYFIT